ncbi:hypothetical protein PHSC3_000857 [Chlamydiales bacterium STE3]|nr:hypothetical protein PHSC3_000857 [Chlamydiales bacterium STE3]
MIKITIMLNKLSKNCMKKFFTFFEAIGCCHGIFLSYIIAKSIFLMSFSSSRILNLLFL